MRIAYVSLHWPRTKSSGIGRKISEQILFWRQTGHEVEFFSHRTNNPNSEVLLEGKNFEFVTYNGFIGKIRTEIGRCKAVLPLFAAVQEFKPDIIYLRWGMYVFPSHIIFRIAPVVVEINTNDVTQHETLGRIYAAYNRLTRGIFLGRAAGLVFTSKELSTTPEFANYQRRSSVIANGIDLSQYSPLPAPGNDRPRIGLIGTPELSWHGIDKLVRFARKCSDLDIDVIGSEYLEKGELLPPNLHLYGYLDQEKSRTVLSKVDVGMGSLALHRICLNEASPLKTREYLAYGIPLVLPYEDTDLNGLDIPTILRIPNKEENVDIYWKEIHTFAFKMRGERINRELIAKRIDAILKEELRVKFFKACLNGSKKPYGIEE
jgi:glycosyltransferase involved in cell wall biosynthesis